MSDLATRLRSYGRYLDETVTAPRPDSGTQDRLGPAPTPPPHRRRQVLAAVAAMLILAAVGAWQVGWSDGRPDVRIEPTPSTPAADTTSLPPTTTVSEVAPPSIGEDAGGGNVDIEAVLRDVETATAGRYRVEWTESALEAVDDDTREQYWSQGLLPDQTWADGGPTGETLVAGLLPQPETRVKDANLWLATFESDGEAQAHLETLVNMPERFGVQLWSCREIGRRRSIGCERGDEYSQELEWRTFHAEIDAEASAGLVPTWTYNPDGHAGEDPAASMVAVRQGSTVAVIAMNTSHDSALDLEVTVNPPRDGERAEATYLATVVAALLQGGVAEAASVASPPTLPFTAEQVAAEAAVREWFRLLANGDYEAAGAMSTFDIPSELAIIFGPRNEAGIDYQPTYCQPFGPNEKPYVGVDFVLPQDFLYPGQVDVECLPRRAESDDRVVRWRTRWLIDSGLVEPSLSVGVPR